jgi:hypothetical protein
MVGPLAVGSWFVWVQSSPPVGSGSCCQQAPVGRYCSPEQAVGRVLQMHGLPLGEPGHAFLVGHMSLSGSRAVSW